MSDRSFFDRSMTARLFELAWAMRSHRRARSIGGLARSGLSVVHLVPSVGWGGLERLAATMHRLSLARGLRSTLDAPSLAILQQGFWEEGVLDVRPSPDALAHDHAMSDRDRAATLRRWAHEARARVTEHRPSVVHAHLPYPDRFGAALVASAGRPLVASFQLMPERGRTFSRDEVFGFRSDTLLDRVGPWLSRVIFVAPSIDDERRLRAIVGPRARVVRVTNCPPLPRVREPDNAAFSWPRDAVRLLAVGRLVRQKGFDRLIDALASDVLAPLAWHLAIVGGGPEEPALRAQIEARALGARVTIDTQRRAASLYATADVLVAASRSEGFPLVPLEAIEAGVPVLLSPIAAHRELMAQRSEALLPDDVARWPDFLARWIRDAEARLALRRAQRSALPEDLRAPTFDAYAQLYREAAGLS